MSGKRNPRVANGAAHRKLRARLRSEGRGCWICRAFGRPDRIDYSLPPGDPMAFEVDDLVPISKGGTFSYANADAAHRRCNQWRGNKSVEEVMALARGIRLGDARRASGTCSREW